jgi:outer membrane protein assembly factor BamB
MTALLLICKLIYRAAVVAGLLVLTAAANATSIRFPKFSRAIFQQDRLIFTTPDSKRVLCVKLNGEKVWETSYANSAELIEGPASDALLQTGNVVSAISPGTGALKKQFSVEDANDSVGYSQILDAFVSHDRRFRERNLKIIDKQTGRPVWRTKELENFVCATPDLMVGLAVTRRNNSKGYTLEKPSLYAFDRKTFRKKWSVPVNGSQLHASSFNAPFLVYADGESSLAVLDCRTGLKQITKQVEVPHYGRIINVTSRGDQIAWFASKMNRKDFDQSEHFLHFCTLPDLSEQKVTTLRVIEISRISFESGFIISDALYRTACFREDGEKVWERFQSERTPVIDNRIYFSDYLNGITRIGVIEVPTGKEAILYSEPVAEL